jgi:hypothetical protein
MTAEELRAIMVYLMERVALGTEDAENSIVVTFEAPSEEEMIAAGLDSDGVRRILSVPWWDEMVEDIVETPDMCDPDDSTDQILEYARDVVSEYIRKRFPLEEE